MNCWVYVQTHTPCGVRGTSSSRRNCQTDVGVPWSANGYENHQEALNVGPVTSYDTIRPLYEPGAR